MTSFTHFYHNAVFTRALISLAIFLLVYLAVVRPLRLQLNRKVAYPMLSTLFHDTAEVFIPNTKQPRDVGVRFQNSGNVIILTMPFGVFLWTPFALLASTRSYGLIKILIYYHIAITFIVPLFFLLCSLFFMRWIWLIIPGNLFNYLSTFLGMIFCVLALKRLSDEYRRISEETV